MSSSTTQRSGESERAYGVIAAFLAQADAGGSTDWRPLVDRHPDLKEELEKFFGEYDALNRLAEPVRPAASDAITPTERARPALPSSEPPVFFGDYQILAEIARGGMGI